MVEGGTEEEFVNRVIAPHLWARGVDPKPILMGGNVTVDRLASEIAHLLWSFERVTSLVDFYGFRDKGDAPRTELQELVHDKVDRKIAGSYDRSRAFPYVQLHEFESLLFSDVTTFGELLNARSDLVGSLQAVRAKFETPEDINDDVKTHPSRRIEDLMPAYQKAVDGPFLADRMGLSTIRAACPRFDQ
ncbi:MAG: DUF4276 family protein [Spirochaetaceae bacterium]|nr:DUF4276 family protein [Spirochaetaceae bacterium]